MPEFVSRPMTLYVEFPSSLSTTSTSVPRSGNASDAVVFELDGTRRPVARARFDSRYAPVVPGALGKNGYFRTIERRISAVALRHPLTIRGEHGPQRGQPGDWLVSHSDDTQEILRPDAFDRAYAPCVVRSPPLAEWLPPGLATVKGRGFELARSVAGVDALLGQGHCELVALAAARCLEGMLSDAALARLSGAPTQAADLHQRIELLYLQGRFNAAQAACAHNLRWLGNRARHVDGELGNSDEPFIQSLLAMVLAAGARRLFGATQAQADALEKAAVLAEVRHLASACTGQERAAAFGSLIRSVGQPGDLVLLFAVERSIELGELAAAHQLLRALTSHREVRSVRRQQLEALLASREGQLESALQKIERLTTPGSRRGTRGQGDRVFVESFGIQGGILKRLWRKSRDTRLLERAHDAYGRAWNAGGSYYAGINYAATAAWLRRGALAQEVAAEVLLLLPDDAVVPSDEDILHAPWLHATRAEAWLLTGRHAEAAELHGRLASVVAQGQPGTWRSIQSNWSMHYDESLASRVRDGLPGASPEYD